MEKVGLFKRGAETLLRMFIISSFFSLDYHCSYYTNVVFITVKHIFMIDLMQSQRENTLIVAPIQVFVFRLGM